MNGGVESDLENLLLDVLEMEMCKNIAKGFLLNKRGDKGYKEQGDVLQG